MTKEEAARILDPETREDALAEIEYYGGFRNEEAVKSALNEACRVAAEELRSKPTSEALTLEQLRGMEGKRVLVRELETGREYNEILKRVSEGGVYLIDERGKPDYGATELYGETWLAYVYPPAHIDREAFCGSWEGEADGYADGELVYDVWRCSGCGHVEETDDPDLLPDFCPDCGLALTEKARAILEKRLRG